MSKPPKVVIPGLNRGQGVPGGFIVGRQKGHGPAELLSLNALRRIGLATKHGVTQSTSQAVSTGASATASLSTGVSSSLSAGVSSTTSLSTAVSTVISGSISTVNSRVDSLSTAVGGGGGVDDDSALSTSLSQVSSSLSGAISSTTSLSTAVSTVDSNQSTSLSQISSSLSSEISTDLSRINSLSTAVGGGPSYEGGPPGSVPLVASLTWVNQGTSVATDVTRGMSLQPQQDGNVHILKTSAPTAPYDVYMRVTQLVLSTTSTALVLGQVGICLRDGVNGDFLNVVLNESRGAATAGLDTYIIAIDYWTSATVFSTTPLVRTLTDIPNWIRVNVTSTTVTLYVSQDGETWLSVGTETIATRVGAITEYGISVRGSTSNTASAALVSYFSTTAPA